MRIRSRLVLRPWPGGVAALSLLAVLAAAPGVAQRATPAVAAGSYEPEAPVQGADVRQRYAIIPTPFGLDRGRCDRVTLSETLSAASNAVLESGVSVAGRTAGDLVGGGLLSAMDAVDQQCIGQVLEYTPDQRTVTWRRDDTGYAVTPETTYRSADERYCRSYRVTVSVGDQPEAVDLSACRDSEGRWRTVDTAHRLRLPGPQPATGAPSLSSETVSGSIASPR